MDLGLKGKVALVAAASQGLGRAVAEELAMEGSLLLSETDISVYFGKPLLLDSGFRLDFKGMPSLANGLAIKGEKRRSGSKLLMLE